MDTQAVKQIDLLTLIGADVKLRRTGRSRKNGVTYQGPCPFCGGKDRFYVYPEHPEGRGLWWCRQCKDRQEPIHGGDAISYIQRKLNVGFIEAVNHLGLDLATLQRRPGLEERQEREYHHRLPEAVEAPGELWQKQARDFVGEAIYHLWRAEGKRALTWLHQERCLTDEIIHEFQLGYNPANRRADPTQWGLDSAEKQLWLPRGIVLPWWAAGKLWRINIRRPVTKQQIEAGERKYIQVAGGAICLYGLDRIIPGKAVLLVESELDTVLLNQAAGDFIVTVATGSTGGGRRMRWILALGQASQVLVAYDADQAGEEASRYWLDALPQARRWRPFWVDATQMAKDGVDVRDWVIAGLCAS